MSANSILAATITIVSIAFIVSPGLLLSYYLFRPEDTVWHWGIGGGLGVVISGCLALLLSYLPFGVTALSFSGLVLALDILFLALLLSGRNKVREVQTHSRSYHWAKQWPSILTLGLFLATVVVMQPLGKLRKESFTEFSIVTGDLQTALWRQELHSLALVPLQIEIVSHEAQTASYKVQVLTNGRVVNVIDLGRVEPNGSVRRLVMLLPSLRVSQRYDLILLKDGAIEPYRRLFFWLKTSLDT
jgi:hypothetical protein